jgi:hypothetical protein
MKKVFAILSIVALASCGGAGSSEVVKQDSTVVADSAVVAPADSVKVDSLVVGGGSGENEVK